jgi:CLIP-associating protein 1/2
MLDTLVESTKKGLSDVNPGVREVARPSFWAFHAIWPKHGDLILGDLDPTQKKQLDKVRPEEIAPIAIAPTRPAIGSAKKSSGIGALLAEKRRAAMAARQDTQRTVSSPVPGSPSLGEGRVRSVSQSVNNHDEEPEAISPIKSNGTSSTPKPLVQETPRSKMASMSLGSPSRESPTRSPLAQKSSSSSSDPMSASSSVASQALKTPSGSRTSFSSVVIPNHADQGSPQPTSSLRQPITPARPSQSSKSLYPQTPINGFRGNVWEDSPGPTAVTPMMVDKLKGRRHERSWWLKRQQCRSFTFARLLIDRQTWIKRVHSRLYSRHLLLLSKEMW